LSMLGIQRLCFLLISRRSHGIEGLQTPNYDPQYSH
jgi:hypothetical protein